jgi:hypothetical protein
MNASRNAREGRYAGWWAGQHTRTARRLFWLGLHSEMAWVVQSQRAGQPLPVRRPRYITRGLRWRLVGRAQ